MFVVQVNCLNSKLKTLLITKASMKSARCEVTNHDETNGDKDN